jgi:hypothetical protein
MQQIGWAVSLATKTPVPRSALRLTADFGQQLRFTEQQ